MKSIATVLLFLSLISISLPQVKAQTEISGGSVDGNWDIEGSPFHINGDIGVEDGLTLTIDPGVEIIFNEHYRFDVKGQLLAIGTKDSKISFSSSNDEINWNGLRFEDISTSNDSSKLVHCIIKNGYPKGNTDLHKSGGGIYIKNVDKLLVAFCEVSDNQTQGGLNSGGGGIAMVNSSPIITQNLIRNNEVLGGHGGGLAIIQNSDPIINNNIIAHNEAFGGGGIAISQCNPVCFNNTLVGNFANHGGGVDLPYGEASFVNNIFYANYATAVGDQVHFGYLYNVNFFHCLIQGGKDAFAQDHQDGAPYYAGFYENNIDTKPEFVDIYHDHRLRDSSLCIGAGVNQVEISNESYFAPYLDFEGKICPIPQGSNIDIGAVENELAIPVSVEKLKANKNDLSLRIFPNPCSIHSVIQFNLNKAGYTYLQIFDSKGKNVFQLVKDIQQSGEQNFNFNLDGLCNGIYYCFLRTRDSFDCKKFEVFR